MQTVPAQVTLNSGHEIPIIGSGTVSVPLPPPEVLTSIFIDAIEAGYRHFDTASSYGTEGPLGRAVAEAIKRGLVKGREEFFITSKLWCCDAHHDLVLPALKKTLERLDMDYVDLYLIHFPARLKQEVTGFNFSKDDIIPFDIKGTWEAMEECSRLGLSKSIGVSNFGTKKLFQLIQHATILPAVNQVEMSVGWQQKKLKEFCEEKGIKVSAWSPLGAHGQMWGSPAVMENPILHQIATSKGKTVAQVALRWLIQQGVIVIVKSFNKERMKQNLQIFEWELSEEELDMISQIPQKRIYPGDSFVSPDGPYKSLEELWDGDP